MVLWREHLMFLQYIPNKRHKLGIKLYMITELNGTIIKLYDFGMSVLSELLPKRPKLRSLPLKESHFPTKYVSGNNKKTLERF